MLLERDRLRRSRDEHPAGHRQGNVDRVVLGVGAPWRWHVGRTESRQDKCRRLPFGFRLGDGSPSRCRRLHPWSHQGQQSGQRPLPLPSTNTTPTSASRFNARQLPLAKIAPVRMSQSPCESVRLSPAAGETESSAPCLPRCRLLLRIRLSSASCVRHELGTNWVKIMSHVSAAGMSAPGPRAPYFLRSAYWFLALPRLSEKRASVTCTTGRRNPKNEVAAAGQSEPDDARSGPGTPRTEPECESVTRPNKAAQGRKRGPR